MPVLTILEAHCFLPYAAKSLAFLAPVPFHTGGPGTTYFWGMEWSLIGTWLNH